VLQDEAFLADVQAASRDLAQLHLWWLGQSGFLVQWHGRHLLVDPYLSDAPIRSAPGLSPTGLKQTDVVVAPRRLNFVQVVAITHTHRDHFDRDTLLALLTANQRLELIIPEASREAVVNHLEIPIELPRGLDAGQSYAVAGFVIWAVPAAHNFLERDSAGRHRYLGYLIQAGPWTLYHAGDTVRYPGMEAWLQRGAVDVALLPINGDTPSWGEPSTLAGSEAAALARDIGARLAIPCHYGMFAPDTASLDAFVAAAQRLGQRYQVLQCGQRWSSGTLAAGA
jgi:L-ascorbate metabolism protein UlaG (beta-lactamase superfamily)